MILIQVVQNRGPNEVINDQQFNGSVRLFRRFSAIPERGHFRCELSNAADFPIAMWIFVSWLLYVTTLIQKLIVNIFHSEFWAPSWYWTYECDHLSLHWLHCHYCWGERLLPDILSNSLDPNRLPSGVPSPNFQWSFNGSTSLPSGVTAMATVISSSNSTSETYTSTLQFSPLSQCHIGNYIIIMSTWAWKTDE